MNSLRSHSFFASVRWDTLWTDSAPPITAGLLQKDPTAGGRRWEDVGAAWDRLIADDGNPEDDIQWDPDANAPDYVHQHNDTNGVAIGPMDEVRGVDLPRSSSLGSSSSEDSPVKNLTNDMQAFSFRAPSPERKSPSHSDHERGRTHATTPVQGNGPPMDKPSVLKFSEGEIILHQSEVETRTLRRRASRLLPIPIPVAPIRPKTRELILTNRRLFCLKHKSRGDLSVKSEFLLRPEKSKERETRSVVTTVELKSEREFIVLTVSIFLLNETASHVCRLRRPTITLLWTPNLHQLGFRKSTLH